MAPGGKASGGLWIDEKYKYVNELLACGQCEISVASDRCEISLRDVKCFPSENVMVTLFPGKIKAQKNTKKLADLLRI